MFESLSHVHRAVWLLTTRNAKIHQRLFEAAREWCLALAHSDQWPDDLRERAAHIQQRLTAQGQIDRTISSLDAEQAGHLAAEMLDLAMSVDMGKQLRVEPNGHQGVPRSAHRRALAAQS